MQMLIGFFILFIPFLFLNPLIKNISQLREIRQKDQIPPSVSLLNPVNENYDMLKQHLLKILKLKDAEAVQICKVFRATQLSIVFYVLGGAFQFLCILVYGVWIYKFNDIGKIFAVNPSQFGAYISMPIMPCITFYIFYGSQFLEYMGLCKTKKNIDLATGKLFEIASKLQKKCIIFFWSCLYFCFLICYLYLFLPFAYLMGEYASIYPLIIVSVLLSVFYYLIPFILRNLFFKFAKKSKEKVDKNTLYNMLKNNTYLYMLIIYFYGMSNNSEPNLLLSGITILFLFDTYLQNRKTIIADEENSKNQLKQ